MLHAGMHSLQAHYTIKCMLDACFNVVLRTRLEPMQGKVEEARHVVTRRGASRRPLASLSVHTLVLRP
jgi:hypothetical protein